jgi:hypothetical protein
MGTSAPCSVLAVEWEAISPVATSFEQASYIVGVSSKPQRLLESPISCDKAAIDYTKQDPFQWKVEGSFDVVFSIPSLWR